MNEQGTMYRLIGLHRNYYIINLDIIGNIK